MEQRICIFCWINKIWSAAGVLAPQLSTRVKEHKTVKLGRGEFYLFLFLPKFPMSSCILVILHWCPHSPVSLPHAQQMQIPRGHEPWGDAYPPIERVNVNPLTCLERRTVSRYSLVSCSQFKFKERMVGSWSENKRNSLQMNQEANLYMLPRRCKGTCTINCSYSVWVLSSVMWKASRSVVSDCLVYRFSFIIRCLLVWWYGLLVQL